MNPNKRYVVHSKLHFTKHILKKTFSLVKGTDLRSKILTSIWLIIVAHFERIAFLQIFGELQHKPDKKPDLKANLNELNAYFGIAKYSILERNGFCKKKKARVLIPKSSTAH